MLCWLLGTTVLLLVFAGIWPKLNTRKKIYTHCFCRVLTFPHRFIKYSRLRSPRGRSPFPDMPRDNSVMVLLNFMSVRSRLVSTYMEASLHSTFSTPLLLPFSSPFPLPVVLNSALCRCYLCYYLLLPVLSIVYTTLPPTLYHYCSITTAS
jgi:hypothetical protein